MINDHDHGHNNDPDDHHHQADDDDDDLPPKRVWHIPQRREASRVLLCRKGTPTCRERSSALVLIDHGDVGDGDVDNDVDDGDCDEHALVLIVIVMTMTMATMSCSDCADC